jgi:hypothetical protein
MFSSLVLYKWKNSPSSLIILFSAKKGIKTKTTQFKNPFMHKNFIEIYKINERLEKLKLEKGKNYM